MIIEARGLKKWYGSIQILDNIDLNIKKGSTTAIVGPSGSGKSTLLNILGTLETADEGSLLLFGSPVTPQEIPRLRNHRIGFVFQSFNLLEDFSTQENVEIPAWIDRRQVDGVELLKWVGLESKKDIPVKWLSGGEKQRVTIARALCNNPDLILADEPSGNLDRENAANIHTLLLNTAKQLGKSVIVVTHNRELAEQCDVVLTLKQGKLWTSLS
ncbi:MAG: ABC transporter ATP-binding protein [Simkaniaceae bacterium]|nr:ABC transporter ATP-binding protein [Simkaniaceae bacterium]